MHTVFVNASGNNVGGRLDVLGMEKEFKQFIMMDTPLSQWYDKDSGYGQCALRLGEMIDSYQEINNRFNLIVYVDLMTIPEYVALWGQNADVVEQNVTYELIRGAMTRLMVAFYDQLAARGRCPAEKLLLLMEQNARKGENRGNEVLGKDLHTIKEKTKADVLLRLLGFPTMEELENKLRQIAPENVGKTLNQMLDQETVGLKSLRFAKLYENQIQTFVKSVAEDREPVSEACYAMLASMERRYEADCNNSVVISEYVTDRRSGYTNKELETKRDLLIQCFLLDCIRSESIYDGAGVKQVPMPTEEDWETILRCLAVKKKSDEKEAWDVQRMEADFTELGLAPELLKLPWERFGLDETGNIKRKLVITGNPEEKKKKKKDKKQKDVDPSGDPQRRDQEDVLVDKQGCVVNWLPGNGLEFTDQDKPVETTKGDHRQNALAMANEHLLFLRTLSLKISRAVANYAGNSLSNKPAILRKRYVSTGDHEAYDVAKDYKYCPGLKTTEDTPVETVRKSAKHAYETLMVEYLKFNASRSVAVTTVREQCQYFINRVRQLEESMKKLVSILLVLAVALLVGYLPFVLVQWETITLNMGTALVALVSLLVPFALLGIGYGVAVFLQKRKIRKAWEELQEISKQAGARNEAAAQAFSELLRKYIPSLRWIYEYLLDVDFYCDCCRVADAKKSHHRQKLQACREVVDNLLEDLEYEKAADALPEDYEIDYTRAYCEGVNRDIYSVLDEKTLDLIRKRKGAQEK
jgi:hypothetical protein